ncbi:hypothetical protein PIROE2DRAFT_70180 [Piromyces sp. E2]|nr:hypothetical protein PIROE2DRAFT_70180 [Piromyces sp. E2]|eukprot:OUM56203.1 hypothetical protein PIROE2DRAFT_70180 [Piromyces sp. E2]
MDQTKSKGESLLPPATVNNSTAPTSKGESLFKFDNMLDDLNDECFNSRRKQQLLLGIYSLETIIRYMDDFKIGKCLEQQGIKEYYFELDTSDWYIHKFYLWMGQKDVTPKDESHLLAEMWFRRVQNIHQVRGIADVAYSDHRAETKRRTHASFSSYTPQTEDTVPEIYHSHDNYLLVNAAPLLKNTFLKLEHIDFIVVEWTRMQNPTDTTKVDDKNQPTCVDPFLLLPGQNYPSLGIGRIIDKVLFRISMDDKKDGILNVPLYFHNAVFYQKENYHFVNPIFEGIYETMYRDLLPWIKEKGLGYVAHGLLRGLVKAWVTFEYVEIISKDDEEEESALEENLNNEEDAMEEDNKRESDDEMNENKDEDENKPVRVEFENGVPIPIKHHRSQSPIQSPESDLAKSFDDNDDVRSFKSDFDSGDEGETPTTTKKKIIYQLPKKNGRPYATVRWKGLDMMYPISQTMKNFYNSKNYKKFKQEYCGSGVFWIDSETNSLLTEKDWQMAVYANDVDTRPASQLKFKNN